MTSMVVFLLALLALSEAAPVAQEILPREVSESLTHALAIPGARIVPITWSAPSNCRIQNASVAHAIDGSGRVVVKFSGRGCSGHGLLDEASRRVHHALAVHARLDGAYLEWRFSDHGRDFDQTIHGRARAAVGRAMERTRVARMRGEEFLHLLPRDVQAVERLLIFSLRLLARLEHRHLHAAVHIDLAVARGLDGAEQALREARGDEALYAVGDARRGHAAERFYRQGHVRLVAKNIED